MKNIKGFPTQTQAHTEGGKRKSSSFIQQKE